MDQSVTLQIDTTDVVITLSDTAAAVAEIKVRFLKLEEGVDMILAAIANMHDYVEGRVAIAGVAR